MHADLDINAEYEALIQFMYMAPVGLVQIANDGQVVMANPMTAQLLMPLAPDGDLANLFDTLHGLAPELRVLVAGFQAPHGTICQDHRLVLDPALSSGRSPNVLAISLIRLDPVRVMAIITDVSELARRERLVLEKDQWHNTSLKLAMEAAQAANIAKSEFLANMSHELRTPMHAIASFAKLGLGKSGDAPREKLQRYFENIDGSALRLNRLLTDLLDLAKIEAGKMTYAFAPHDLAALLRAGVAEFEAMADARGVALATRFDGVVAMAEVDGTRIQQVFANLLSNAVKFSPAGSTVAIQLELAPNGAGEDDALVSIADQGPGIPADELDLVFDKFVQSSKTKTGAGGTGLGLPITREILAAHGAEVRAHNRPEGGAEFRVRIPLRRPESSSTPPAPGNVANDQDGGTHAR